MDVIGELVGAAEGLVAAGEVPGVVVGVTDGERQWVRSVGVDRPGGEVLPGDAVFRVSSMTKPLMGALTLRLVDDGVLALDDPVGRWLPELAGQRVVRRLDGPVEDTVAAESVPTVEDLLVMRLGFGFAFEVDQCPVADAAVQAGLGMGPPLPSAVSHEPDEWVRRFAELPLMEQPGRHWRYEFAYAVLGVVLSRASGVDLPALLADRVLNPLGMSDTGFVVPEHARERLIPCFTNGSAVFDGVADSDWLGAPAFPHAGGGLVSTAADYLTFAGSLLSGDSSAMTVDRLTPEQRLGASAQIFLDGEGWGYGVQVRRSGPGIPARYGWGGGLGTLWYNYPDHGIGAVLMTQHLPPSPATIATLTDTLDAALAT
ncbi:beta-lactamase family protein [Kribbella qitaiheensis]|uniref:Beta-lactamase family protein n=1 Tax=Kribbella qitaiheensis TaxID=1544730 RepID=A0A7G6X5B7_9ACTN|nr:serine hydrolase domain-containing protein [Kribbella qitaiheensis]QNE21432.1 beta-lactamase family protein [Kribbella qitaiheensis]